MVRGGSIHGKNSVKQKKNKEILVPIILYMDSINTDKTGRLSLTPLNFTLGIFNTDVRTRPEAWTTIYFHPDNESESVFQSRKPNPREGIQNLHIALSKALESFHEVNEAGGLDWDLFPYVGKK